MSDNVTMTDEAIVAPEDLCTKAVKLARRIQALKPGVYDIQLVKHTDPDLWTMIVEGTEHRVEVLR